MPSTTTTMRRIIASFYVIMSPHACGCSWDLTILKDRDQWPKWAIPRPRMVFHGLACGRAGAQGVRACAGGRGGDKGASWLALCRDLLHALHVTKTWCSVDAGDVRLMPQVMYGSRWRADRLCCTWSAGHAGTGRSRPSRAASGRSSSFSGSTSACRSFARSRLRPG